MMENIAFAMWSLQGMLMEKCFTPDQEQDRISIFMVSSLAIFKG